MEKRKIQIDVMGPVDTDPNVIKMNIYIDGRCCQFITTRSNYEALMYDGIFIRDGKTRDSAGVLNTTNMFVEEKNEAL